MSTKLKKIMMKDYYEKFLVKGIREDGREFLESREIVIQTDTISTSEGSSIVKLGDMTMLCTIKAEIATPHPDFPKRGFFIPGAEITAICENSFSDGAPQEMIQEITVYMYDMIVKSNVLDLESLCIKEGSSVWALYADVFCINYDGNVYSASCLAMMAALLNVRLPKVVISEEDEGDVLPQVDFTHLSKLRISDLPITSTFSHFEDKLILDPTFDEEEAADNAFMITIDSHDQICESDKMGGKALSRDDIKMFINKAVEVARTQRHLLQQVTSKKDNEENH